MLVEVLGTKPSAFRRRGLSIVSVKVGDESGAAKATWFNQPWVAQKLVPGTGLLLTGSRDKRGFRVSEYEFMASGPRVLSPPPAGDAELVPVHPATARLKAQRIRQWMEQAVAWAGDAVEALPAELRARRGLAGVGDAIKAVHFPGSEEEAVRARERLGFEELFLYQAILRDAEAGASGRAAGAAAGKAGGGWSGGGSSRCRSSRPGISCRRSTRSTPTSIRAQPMQRLLMGEVGSGKTVVALYSMLRALEAGFQAVLMAPTETLAEQHAATLDRLLGARATPLRAADRGNACGPAQRGAGAAGDAGSWG